MEAGSLRKPFLIAALVLLALAVAMEVGFSLASPYLVAARDTAAAAANADLAPSPPGIGIGALGLLDGLVLFTGVLLAAPLVISHSNHAKVQGIATLIVGIFVLISCIATILVALAKLMLMIALLLAFPFGTIAYLVAFADFNRPLATGILATLMFCKIGFAVCLVLAHEGMLKNKSLILIIATSLMGNIVVGFLHGLVPGILVSIMDAVAAILVTVLALVWAVFFLIGSISSIIALVKMVKSASHVVPRS